MCSPMKMDFTGARSYGTRSPEQGAEDRGHQALAGEAGMVDANIVNEDGIYLCMIVRKKIM